MASKYSVTYNGVGYGEGRSTKSFSRLEDVTEYVKARFDEDYQDGESEFHNDYGVFTLRGVTLAELGLGRYSIAAKFRDMSISELVQAGRFVVVFEVPQFDGRDAYCGSKLIVHRHYDTREEAEAVADNESMKAEGSDIDVKVEPRKPWVRPVGYSSFLEDVPF